MYLKRLQTVGFKSFAERIDIHFNKGLTAIVGPNGSGKSNIIDAVRWVLGEQSARSLRGQKMEDIIFQGSDTRNPMNFAEVTLTLDNITGTLPLDYDEISVKRRVYRSGESEFFINKQACRLKDIIDLFMDSGLGKEAFSIISQGKVEEILMSKANERRVIFEEAAGVLKYKQRKAEAQFKLTETEENLNRVEDIIYEVEHQIEPLKNQAQKANDYNELSEQLKQIEVRLLITEISTLHDQWQDSLQTIERKQLKEITIKTNIQDREAKLTENRHRLQQLDEKVNELQVDLLEATEQLEKFEGEKNVLDERLKHYAKNKVKLEEEKEAILLQKSSLIKDIENERETLQVLKIEKKTIVDDINNLKEKIHSNEENLHDIIEDLKSDYIEYLNRRAVMQNERETIKQDIEKLNDRQSRYVDDYSEVVNEREILKEKLHSINDQIKQVAILNEKEKNEKENLISQVTELNNRLNDFKQKRFQEAEQVTKLTSRKETLEEMKESYQGYFFGVRELLKRDKNKEQFNIFGTVFDLINVPHTYVTAIDTVLGAQAQYVVLQSEKNARDAIHWLKKENKGRATFLPLNAIETRLLSHQLYENIKDVKGFIGIASQLIEIDDQLQTIADHLLGNVIVTTNLEAANSIARLTNRRYRIVTLDGDIVYPGGSMSGGAKKRSNQSLFTREKDLQLITKTITKHQNQINELTNEIKGLENKITQINKKLENSRIHLHNQKEMFNESQSTYTQIEMQLNSLNNELKSYDLTVKHEEEEREQLITKNKELSTSLLDIEATLETTEDKINELTAKAEQKKIVEEKQQQQLHKLQITLAERQERLKNEHDKVQGLEIQLEKIMKQYDAIILQLEDLKEISTSEEQKLLTEQKIEQQLNIREKASLTLKEKRSNRIILTEQIEDEARDLKEEHKHHEHFISLIQAEEVKANRLDVALDTRLTQLEKEYVTTYEKANKQFKKVLDINKATERVSELKRQINRLGTVNLGAIEEYERIVERYEFLTEQQNDLIEAKETLYSVIKKMDKEMINRFSTTFEQIQKAFTEVFKELFGGGHARLKLTDETNLLETGIEIVARPPGKKLRTLDLLSGGEKALTAISLLFAILRVRPVPFVILDEVEAALDEANIIRFAKYLTMYRDDTQFIVITHRKGTMEEADVLYGVTMQESGVSRLVSVKLEETEELVTAN